MQQLIDKFRETFKEKGCLFAESKCYSSTLPNSPTSIIIDLHNQGYNFTESDFNTFILRATYTKTRGYFHAPDNWYRNAFPTNRGQAIDILFTKFTPNEKQFKLLFACYSKKSCSESNGYQDWFNVLIKKGYIFTDEQIQELSKIGYNTIDILAKSNVITLDNFKAFILSQAKNKEIYEIKALADKCDIPIDFVDWILLNYRREYGIYGNRRKTIYVIKNIITALLGKIPVIINSIEHLTWFNCCELIYFCIENGLQLSHIDIVELSNSSEYAEILFFLYKKKNFEFTSEIMNNMILSGGDAIQTGDIQSSKYRYVSTTNCNTIKKMLLEFGYSKNIIDDSIVQANHGDKRIVSMYFLLKNIGVKPDLDTFKNAYNCNKEHIINDCIANYKMVPTHEHLQITLAKYTDIHIINKIMHYKIVPSIDDYKLYISNNSCSIDVIELLVNYGLKLTIECVGLALGKKLVIENLDRFNIKYDEELYHICYINNMFPYDELMPTDVPVFGLRKLCRSEGLTKQKLKKYISENNVKFDNYCFDHICHYNSNLVGTLLNEFKLKATKTMYYWLGFSKCYFYHFDKYVESNEITLAYMKQQHDIEFKDE